MIKTHLGSPGHWRRIIAAAVVSFLGSSALCQEPQPPGLDPASETVRLRTQGEIPLSDFVDYVAQRLQVRLLYDDSIKGKRLNLVAPDPIPVESLPEILQSVLINQGLVITDRDPQGFRRIVSNDQIPRVARPSEPGEDLRNIEAAVPLTRIFVLADAEPSKLAELLSPFLSPVGASAIPIDRSDLLLVTDVARNIRRAEQLIKVLDGKEARVEIEFVAAENVEVETLADQLRSILDARQKAQGLTDEESGSGQIEVDVDSRTNSIILIGTPAEIGQATKLLKQLDRSLDTQESVFTLRFFSPEAFDERIRSILQGRARRPPYRSRIEGNNLIVDSTPEVLELVRRIQTQIDTREAPSSQSPVRFYKIKNVPAQELIETIRGIGGNVNSSSVRRPLQRRSRTTNDLAVPGPNQAPFSFPGSAQPIRPPLSPPAFRPTTRGEFVDPLSFESDVAVQLVEPGFSETDIVEPVPQIGGLGPEADNNTAAQLLRQAIVTVDVHTNTIIVVAPPETQRIYASLIEQLDVRRPQVLIEAQIVIIDTSDDFALGVEVSGGDRSGINRLFSFSSYGLSTVDPVTGALGIIPGVGFNGTLVDPDTADVVVQALTTHTRARVMSTPKILVNDNAEGQLTSVAEVPFTSINASDTVATTSFAGFAEAGTTITVTPTISDDNYLQLDYVVTLNSFTGTGSDGVPPPRQTNEVRSRVTVPDGYTVIVGGLTSTNDAYEIDSIPFLERIPIIRELSSLQTTNSDQTSLFVFLRPVILREDKFKDLRFLSDVELREAELPTNFPVNQPLLIK